MLTLLARTRLPTTANLALAPFLWVTVELARSRVTSFPWDLLGYTAVNNLLVTSAAPFTGVLGVSFIVAAVNSLIAPALLSRTRSRFALPAIAAFLVAALEVAGRDFSHHHASFAGDRIAILLQENLKVGAPGRSEAPLSREEELRRFIALSAKPSMVSSTSVEGASSFVPGGHAMQPGVVVWPEAPSHLQSDDPLLRASLGTLARELQVPLIIGSLGIDPDNDAARGYRLFDSASLFMPDGSYAGRYDKIHLVPWGEYIPFKDVFSFAHRLTEGVGDMDRGNARTVFSASGQRFGIFICYESIFGDEVRQFVRNGAEVLVNISDDGWYGDTGAPWQHLDMARMRAIENHRWILRSTNTGVTTSIDPWGRLVVEAPRHVRDAYAFPYGLEHDVTFYTAHGDWFAFLCAGVTLVAVGIAISGDRWFDLSRLPKQTCD